MKTFKAEIISIGNEVLAGYTVNTNATYISQKLLAIGLPVSWVSTIRDEHDEIMKALELASGRADVILITGGLGPTPDDITKATASEFFNRSFERNETVLRDVNRFLQERNVQMNDANIMQAQIPQCDFIIRNPVGTAPGLGFVKNNSHFIFMPGVPGEMKRMVSGYILDYLSKALHLPQVHTALLRSVGITEARLYEKLKKRIDDQQNIELSFLPRYIGVDMRFRLISDNEQEIAHYHSFIKGIKEESGKYIFTDRQEDMEETLGRILQEQNLTLSIAESFTGGLIADLITNIPGSSHYLLGGITSYSNQSKQELIAVRDSTLKQYGAVSEQVALQMVRGVQQKFSSDCAISTTGIAGPGGATETKPVGLCYIAIRVKEKEVVKEFRFGTERIINKRRGAMAAMELLRRLLVLPQQV